MCNDNPEILLFKVDFDENRDVVKPLAIKVRGCMHAYLAVIQPSTWPCVLRMG